MGAGERVGAGEEGGEGGERGAAGAGEGAPSDARTLSAGSPPSVAATEYDSHSVTEIIRVMVRVRIRVREPSVALGNLTLTLPIQPSGWPRSCAHFAHFPGYPPPR